MRKRLGKRKEIKSIEMSLRKETPKSSPSQREVEFGEREVVVFLVVVHVGVCDE
jgi:hypothetical protein